MRIQAYSVTICCSATINREYRLHGAEGVAGAVTDLKVYLMPC